jgi:hypothetical protein
VYSLATSNGFTRGRRTNQVAAACLYIVLRQDRRPYMLIDFCHLLSVNVYVLGSTYIRLTERLRLDTHPLLVSAVDPSLFLHRFAGRLALPEGKLEAVVRLDADGAAPRRRLRCSTVARLPHPRAACQPEGRHPRGFCRREHHGASYYRAEAHGGGVDDVGGV